jgi:hypothetical protein
MRRSMVTLALIALPFLASVSQAQGRPDQRDWSKSEKKEQPAKCEKGPSEQANPMARAKGAGSQEDNGKHKGQEKRCTASGDDTGTDPQPQPDPDPAPTPAPSGLAEIRGMVFVDMDGNNTFDSGEPAVAGWSIDLSGPVNASLTTDGFGNFAFTGLPAGTYTVCAQSVPGFTPVAPASGPGCSSGFGFSLTVPSSMPAQVFSNINFGYKM